MLFLGIDDAGRGPVIGPMVLAGVLLKKEDEPPLKRKGVKDSKMIDPETRTLLEKEIKAKAIAYHIAITEAEEIDARLNSGVNLNKVEALKTAEIINAIQKTRENEQITVIVDCPSPNTHSWREYLMKHIHHHENLIVKAEHKADVHHVSCSAASILAKVTRDREIEKIKKRIGVNFGSGYPSDPVTIKFLKEHGKKFRKEKIFRETWGTWKEHEKKHQQKSIIDFG